jgi:hypothetical protein
MMRNPTRLLYGSAKSNVTFHQSGQVQPAGILLNVSPVGPDIDFLSKGNFHQVFERFLQCFSWQVRRSGIARNVNNETHAVVGNDLRRWRRDHHYVAVGNDGVSGVLREWPLIQSVADRWAGAEIISFPVVLRNGGPPRNRRKRCSRPGAQGVQKSSSIQALLPPLLRLRLDQQMLFEVNIQCRRRTLNHTKIPRVHVIRHPVTPRF